MKAIKAMEAEGWELGQCQHDNGYVYQTFRKPIEKPMPKLEAGDYAQQLGGTSFYVMQECVDMYITSLIVKLYRHGKLIWRKDGNS